MVAADSPEIVEACRRHGVEAVLTRGDHATGSDRLAEACDLLGLGSDELVVNVQGDEPLIEPALIDAVAALLAARPEASMSHRRAPHRTASTSSPNPNVVKVVLDARGLALYFSRAPIPWWRDGFAAGIQSLPEPRAAAPRRHLRLPRGFPARSFRGWRRRRSNASRRWSSCAPCGTATGSRCT